MKKLFAEDVEPITSTQNSEPVVVRSGCADDSATATKAGFSEQLIGMAPLICIVVVFYFFILRTQSKKIKERAKMIYALKVRD